VVDTDDESLDGLLGEGGKGDAGPAPLASVRAWSKQAIARRSISSCCPLLLCIRTTEVSSPSLSEKMVGPPSVRC